MRFLSPAWLESMRSATSAASPAADLRIRQRVTGGPDGDVEYTLALGEGGVVFDPGSDGPADVDLTTDYDTAAAISQGRLSPASAFAAGRLRMGGAVGSLVGDQVAFADMGRLLAGVAAETPY